MEFKIPPYVKNIIKKLEENHYEAFIVGGSIRDFLLGIQPSDFDIATNAKPEDIQSVFKESKTFSAGKDFGTIVIVDEEGSVEVTTYRIEGKYLDGRRPSEVIFSHELYEDLKRRDFTINALAYNESIGLVDYFQAREDLDRKIIKSVGDPIERFKEDHLRILRAVRFAAELGFAIEGNTYNACKELGYLLERISVERIREEIFKILLSQRPSYGIDLLKNLNLIEYILPELVDTIGFEQYSPHHDKDVYYHSLCVVENCPPKLEIRLAALFHDIGKPHTFELDEEGRGHFRGHDEISRGMAISILERLKCSNELVDDVSLLIGEHMTAYGNFTHKGLKRLIGRLGKDRIFKLITLQKADKICSAGDKNIDFLLQRENEIKGILESAQAYEKNQLAINGHDLIQEGYVQGEIIGEILDYLLEQVIEEPSLNERQRLLKITRENFALE